jgi:hypothetical protein
MIIVISLSPLANLGKNSNQFNSIGMWLAVGLVLVLYVIPLMIYFLGNEFIKYIMAVLCLIGLLISIGITLFIVAIDHFGKDISTEPTLLGSMICCGLLFLTNIIWLIVAFVPISKNIVLKN